MKKVIFIAAALCALAACNKEVISAPSSEVGYLSFGLSADDVIIETKAVTAAELDLYKVYIGNTSHTYGTDIKNKVLEIAPGNYNVYAENISAEEAHNGNGALRLATANQQISVEAGATTTTTLNCVAVNSKINVTFSDSFKKAFSSWSVVIGYEGNNDRDKTITHESTNAEFFYNVHQTVENIELALTASATDISKSHTTKFKLQAGYHYTVNYSAGENGFVGITVTADDNLIDADDTNVTVNPYTPAN